MNVHQPQRCVSLLSALLLILASTGACTSTAPQASIAGSGPPPTASAIPVATLTVAAVEEPLPHVYGGSQASAVVRFGDRLMAFGGVNGGCCDGSFSTDTQLVVWISADGHDWALAPAGPEMALGVVRDAVATSDQIVVVGYLRLESTLQPGGAPAPAVWTSEDGVDWLLFRGVPLLTSVEATADGFLGVSNVKAFPELWWSRTGRDWELVAGKEAFGSGRINQLVSTPDGLIAVGSSVNPEAATGTEPLPDGNAAVWLSPDGRSWTTVPASDALTSAVMHDVAWVGGRLVAIGMDAALEENLAWASEDGRAWGRIAASPAGGTITQLTMVLGLPDRFVIAGNWLAESGESGIALWATPDGLAWERIDPVAGQPGGEALAAIGMEGGGAAIVGASWNAEALRRVPGAWLLEVTR